MVQRNGVQDRRRRVVLYCRVSASDQDNDLQERDLKEYAERAGLEIVGVFRETLSGIRKAKGKQPIERKKVMALAQDRRMDAVLVTELTRWGRSTQDLMDTLGLLASWDVSLITQTELTFDLSTPQGKLIANLMASLAEFEFEHDLLRERVRSGIVAANARGQSFGRRQEYRPSSMYLWPYSSSSAGAASSETAAESRAWRSSSEFSAVRPRAEAKTLALCLPRRCSRLRQ